MEERVFVCVKRPAHRRRHCSPIRLLITHQAHLATAGCGKPGFRRPRDDVSQDPDADLRPPASHRVRLRFVSVVRMSLVRNQDSVCGSVLKFPRERSVRLLRVSIWSARMDGCRASDGGRSGTSRCTGTAGPARSWERYPPTEPPRTA